jgi:hypothetical protein
VLTQRVLTVNLLLDYGVFTNSPYGKNKIHRERCCHGARRAYIIKQEYVDPNQMSPFVSSPNPDGEPMVAAVVKLTALLLLLQFLSLLPPCQPGSEGQLLPMESGSPPGSLLLPHLLSDPATKCPSDTSVSTMPDYCGEQLQPPEYSAPKPANPLLFGKKWGPEQRSGSSCCCSSNC